MIVKVKRGDTAVTFTDILVLDGAGVSLTGATVLFRMSNGTTTVSGTATITSPDGGGVSYTVGASDLAVAGNYQQEWEVTFPLGTKLTFPSDGYNVVKVLADV